MPGRSALTVTEIFPGGQFLEGLSDSDNDGLIIQDRLTNLKTGATWA